MKLYAIALFLLGSFAFPVFAQSDSLAVVKADWKKQRIAPGVRLKTFWFNKTLFGSNQNVSILEIKPKGSLIFDLGYDAKKLISTSNFGKSANAIAALNGTFFDVANGGSADFIKSDGVIINQNRLGKAGQRSGHQRSALVFNKGKLNIAKWDGDPAWEKSLIGEDIMVSGPLLILDQKEEKLDTANLQQNTASPNRCSNY